MFTLSDEFDWPVTVRAPKDGGFEEQTFTVRFRAMSSGRAKQLAEDLAPVPARDQERKLADLLPDVVVGWRDVVDEGGKPIAFDDKALGRVLDLPYVRVAMMAAYVQAITGPMGPVGNSAPPPAEGPAAAPMAASTTTSSKTPAGSAPTTTH